MYQAIRNQFSTPDPQNPHPHHAPAGGTSGELASEDSQDRPMGAPEPDSAITAGSNTVTDPTERVSTPGTMTAIADRFAKFRSASNIRAVSSPSTVRDAMVCAADEAVNAIREAPDVDSAIAIVSDLTGLPLNCASGLVGYFVSGEPPAGSVVNSLLMVLTSGSAAGGLVTPPASPVDTGVVDLLLTGMREMRGSSAPIDEAPARVLAVRLQLASMPPLFWLSLSSEDWGSLVIPNMDWGRAVSTVPLTTDAIRTNPIPAMTDIRKLVKSAVQNKSAWPQSRFIFMAHLAAIYGSHAGILLLQGEAEALSRTAAEEKVGSVLIEVLADVPQLHAQATESMRKDKPHEVASAIVGSIDNHLVPESRVTLDSDWHTMKLVVGDSCYLLFTRIREMGALLAKSFDEITERLKIIFLVVGRDPVTPNHVAIAVANVSSHLVRVIPSSKNLNAFDRALKAEIIFTQVLWPKPRPKPLENPANANASNINNATLATGTVPGSSPPKPKIFHDLISFYSTYLTITGKPLGDGVVPPSRARGKCNICAIFGVQIVPWSEESKESMRGDFSRRYDHNEWSCIKLKDLALKVEAEFPGKGALQMCRPVDNPRDMAAAAGIL